VEGAPAALTTAELRLLPLSSTYLPIPEIAQKLSFSPHTIRAHVRSTYRKLNASSRSDSVARAHRLGPLEGLNQRTEAVRPGSLARRSV